MIQCMNNTLFSREYFMKWLSFVMFMCENWVLSPARRIHFPVAFSEMLIYWNERCQSDRSEEWSPLFFFWMDGARVAVKPFSCSFASAPQSFYHILGIFLPVRGAYSFHSFLNGLPRVSICDKWTVALQLGYLPSRNRNYQLFHTGHRTTVRAVN